MGKIYNLKKNTVNIQQVGGYINIRLVLKHKNTHGKQIFYCKQMLTNIFPPVFLRFISYGALSC